MPTTTTDSKGSPRTDRTRPFRTSSTKASRRSRTSHEALMASSMGTASSNIDVYRATFSETSWCASPRRARSAVWSTARRSDVLMRSPFCICLIFAGTSMVRASSKSLAIVPSETFCRVQSRKTPQCLASSDMALKRCGSSRSSRRCSCSMARACFWRSRYSPVSLKATTSSSWPPMSASAASLSVKPNSVRCERIPSSISFLCRSW
mmetsp:Transcript_16911/g.48215  ORF Transcript_16911/g.48215 Transcript_16911/m.48215 type:complete len:207 (-) Transcript_16911:443-1063(-)